MLSDARILNGILASLAALALWLILPSTSAFFSRASPPAFFKISLFMIALAFMPKRPLVAATAVAASVFANVFLAVDHIHGNCWYEALWGEETYHKQRLGDLKWFEGCVQPSRAFWVMVMLAELWLGVFIATFAAAVCEARRATVQSADDTKTEDREAKVEIP